MGITPTFEQVLASFGQDSQVKGRKFEDAIKWWLTNDPFWKNELKPSSVSLWSESKYRNGPDIGIDLTAEDYQGNTWAIQVKNWNQEKSLPKSEIDKFLSASNTKQFSRRLLITTTQNISSNAIRAIDDQEKPCVVITRSHLSESEIWDIYGQQNDHRSLKSKTLFPHQVSAVNAVVSALAEGGRGQLLMACGSGKTITAQRIHEGFGSQLTLVLLPSLLLVQQTLQSWRKEAVYPFLSLAVCSDASVNGDEPITKVAELPFPVTTDPSGIRAFLNLPGKKVIFSSYQSSHKLEEALAEASSIFELVICDEAHRLAGKVDKSYGTVMRTGAIPSHRYLFMTATPKVFSSRIKRTAEDDDIEINSMDDAAKFGEVIHHFSFSEAIESGTLTDYKVVLMGVDDSMIHDLIENRHLLDLDGSVIEASSLAAQYGVAKAMQNYSIPRVISFHSRVAKAAEFARLHPVIHQELRRTTVMAEVISGKDSSARRRVLLDRLRDLDGFEFGLVGNAKCLTEGVDVPSLDGVAFVDPRSSQVDIVQAVGRAIRRGGPNKKFGYIIVPIFFSGEDLDEERINESQFRPVWEVLNALKSHDSTLEEEINALRRNLAAPSGKPELPSRVILDLPISVPISFASQVKTFLLERTSSIWEEWFARLQDFAATNGHCRPKREYTSDEESRLAYWVMKQRHAFNKGKLSLERIKLLESVPHWTWDPFDTQWMEYFERLSKYVETHGNSQVPSTYRDEDGKPLGKWVAKLRSKADILKKGQVELLSNLPHWTWDPFQDQWLQAYEEIKKKAEEQGDTTFSRSDKFSDGRSIGGWVIKQRQTRGELSMEKLELLENLPKWSWDPNEELKKETQRELLAFAKLHGHTRVPQDYECPSGMKLGSTVGRLRRDFAKNQLDGEWIEFISKLPGWQWNTRTEDWQEKLELLKEFVSRNDRLPKADEVFKDEKIGWWVKVQRQFLKKGYISEHKKLQLEQIPYWTWDVQSEKWHHGFENLMRFLQANDGRPPKDKEKTPDGFGVGVWVYNQRKRFTRLSPEQQEKLYALAWFEPITK